MRRLTIAAVLALASAAAPLFAQEGDANGDAARRWSLTVTPRVQQLFFLPDADADGLETLTSVGASVSLRRPDGRVGITATVLGGKGSGTYDFTTGPRKGQFGYRGSRREAALLGEYTAAESNVTLLGGYHGFGAKAREQLLNGGTDSEANRYRFSIDAAEIGLRLSSRLSAESRHAVSAQFSMGLGHGRFTENEASNIGGVVRTSIRDKTGIGYIGDIALGYNYFLTDKISVGGRGRGYVFYVDTKGSYPIFAVTPEFNVSFRF